MTAPLKEQVEKINKDTEEIKKIGDAITDMLNKL